MCKKLFVCGIKRLTRLFVLLLSLIAIPSHAIETITYYHTDSLGSPVAGTDTSGALLWKEDYKPYGERIRKQVESDKNTRWFTGHPEDKETGLTYAGARFYDSVTGRFLAVDPVGFKENNLQMFNRYAYGNNNPYKYVDPDGEAGTLAACAAGPLGCAIGVSIAIIAVDQGIKGTLINNGSHENDASAGGTGNLPVTGTPAGPGGDDGDDGDEAQGPFATNKEARLQA